MNLKHNHDFDPDFSEFNPILEELRLLKESTEKVHKENFFKRLFKKLDMTIIISTD